MLMPNLSSLEIGTIGENLVHYKLTRWGENSLIVSQNNPYDIIVLRDKPVKIQVKTTESMTDYSYKFTISRSNGSCKTQPYTESDYNAICFVALDIEMVLFLPFIPDKITKRIKPDRFNPDDEHDSWYNVLDTLGLGV